VYIAGDGSNRIRKVTIPTSAVQEITFNSEIITIYPNPANTSITILSANKINQITITNLIGQTVYNQAYDIEKAEVNIATLPPQAYTSSK
jgi:hypothetical protein